MDQATVALFCALVLGGFPLVLQLLWYWNDLCYVSFRRLRSAFGGGRDDGRIPPGHMGLPFLGETLTFLWYFKILRRPDDFINSKKQKYGEGVGLYRSHIFGMPTIIACSPASSKFVLQSEPDLLLTWPRDGQLVGKNSMLNVHGARHARVRRVLEAAINRPASLRRIAAAVQPRVVSDVGSWAERDSITAYDEIKKLTFENICKMFIGMDAGPRTDALANYFYGMIPGLRAYPLDVPGTAFHSSLQCRRKLEKVFRGEIERRKQKRAKECSAKSTDLMDGLMEIEDDEGNRLSDDEVLDNIISLVVGGFESTTLSSMWALYFLSKSPQVLQKLREENATVRKERKGDFITVDDISRLKYTAKVVEETIRMANIALLSFRSAQKDVEYRGYKIPKGWQVIAWIRSLHVDPNNFEDPLNFNPERWNSPPKPATYQVFGWGPRLCPGNMLARMQISIILHHLSLGYRWELLNPDAKIQYLPHPLPVDRAVMRFRAL